MFRSGHPTTALSDAQLRSGVPSLFFLQIESRRTPDKSRFKSLVTIYKASKDYKKLAESTRANWATGLTTSRIISANFASRNSTDQKKFGLSSVAGAISGQRPPRTADYGLQVLSRVCAFGVDPLGKLASNPCEGIKQLYSANRSEIVWTDANIAQLKKTCSPEIAHAVDLASHTGLRLSDLMRVSWSHVGEVAIEITTGKSKHRREAIVPLYDDLKAVLSRIPKRATTILTNSRGHPWTPDGFGSSFNKAKIDAGLADADLHFHDLRGTAATRFYKADLRKREIAEIMGWEEEQVEKIIRKYVDRNAATRAVIARLNKRGT